MFYFTTLSPEPIADLRTTHLGLNRIDSPYECFEKISYDAAALRGIEPLYTIRRQSGSLNQFTLRDFVIEGNAVPFRVAMHHKYSINKQ